MKKTITNEEMEKLLASIKIPPRPAGVRRNKREKNKEYPNLKTIGQTITKDMALTAAMLKTANSSFFGLRTKVETAQSAVSTLGVNTTLGIVTGIALKNAIGGDHKDLERFWARADKVANIASFLSGKVPGVPKDMAYMYGLFRDCGIPIMMHKFPEYSKTLMKINMESILKFTLIEDESHATNHATIGYLLARSWSLPNSICQAVLNHHEISVLHSNEELSAEARGLIAVIRFAEFLCDASELRDNHEWEVSGSTVLSYLGLSEDEFNDIQDEVHQYQT